MKKKFLAAAAIALSATVVAAPTVDARPAAAEPSIVQTALAVNAEGGAAPGAFDTLIAAVTCESQSGVLDLLSQKGQYTVFAPVDDAFAAIGLTPENICELDGAFLGNVLAYHVAKGNRDSGQVLDSSTIKMLNGERVAVDTGALKINDSNLVLPFIDVPASNGIIHVIDAVLLPGS